MTKKKWLPGRKYDNEETTARLTAFLTLSSDWRLFRWLNMQDKYVKYLNDKNDKEEMADGPKTWLSRNHSRHALLIFAACGWTFIGIQAFFSGSSLQHSGFLEHGGQGRVDWPLGFCRTCAWNDIDNLYKESVWNGPAQWTVRLRIL